MSLLAPRSRGLPALQSGGLGSRRSLGSHGSRTWSFLRHLDWVLILAVLALCVLGSLLVWSATKPDQIQAGANPRACLYKDVLWFGIGLVLMVGVAMMNVRRIRILSPVVYGAALLGLLAVLTPLGSASGGAHAWFNLPGGFQVEPSEFGKLGLVLICAMVLSRLGDSGKRPRLREIGLAVVCAVPLAEIGRAHV